MLEDRPDVSFAGQHDTVLKVLKHEQLWEAIRTCWASLWGRAIHYLCAMDMSARKMKLALAVQELVEADASGVAFTKDDLFLHEFLFANCWEQGMHRGYGDFLLGGGWEQISERLRD